MVNVTHCIWNVWYTGDAVCRFIYKANDRIVETVATDLNEKKDNNNKYSKSYRLTLTHPRHNTPNCRYWADQTDFFTFVECGCVWTEHFYAMQQHQPEKSMHTEREQMKQKHSRKKHNIK